MVSRWQTLGIVQIQIEVPRVEQIVPQGLLVGPCAVESRLELPPDFGLNLILAAVLCALLHKGARAVPFGNVDGDQTADFTITVVLAEQADRVPPELRLGNGRKRPR